MGKAFAALVFVAVLTVLPSAPTRAGEAFKVEDLMAEMRLVHESKAYFTERRMMAMLNTPLETKGTLRYKAPDYLVKQTLQPHAEKLTVRGDLITIVEGRERLRSLSLSDAPQVSALVESIRGTLSGDLDALRRYYNVAVTGTIAGWALTLTPLEGDLAKLISTIKIAGTGNAIRTVDALEANGDRTVMTIFGEDHS